MELEEISKPTLDSARAVLERKAKIYEKLRKGKTGGLNDAQYDALLVDVRHESACSSPCGKRADVLQLFSLTAIRQPRNTTKKIATMKTRA